MTAHAQKAYGVPIAIVIAGLLIAGAIAFGSGGTAAPDSGGNHVGNQPSGDFRIPNADDHVRGNPDAPIAIVEFSDLECPFCARIHPTLERIVGENDDVKWIFRHFPLSSIHSRALSAAVASECIARLGGNDAFWSFTDVAFADQSKLGDAWYREVATSLGIDTDAFNTCTNDRAIVADIQVDLDEAAATGGRGTPYVVIVTQQGQLIPFSGALPYEQVAGLVDQARAN